jgi:hypothetical protein
MVAVFHAVFDITTATPTTVAYMPTLMGAAVTIVGLATIPYLARVRATGAAQRSVESRSAKSEIVGRPG